MVGEVGSGPVDVDDRLNLLLRAAAAAGERTSRSELLAALVATADLDPTGLAALLHTYRQMPDDALTPDDSHDALPVVRSPGPRRTLT
ncbi:hypothetical protein OG539_43565 [Actinacidiphila glaucinigra]|uniref:hypothetical protein n=1 Tax=Actinacidiphila glaucinigra TaxID=235986 RepID=UPI00324532EA